MLRQTQALALPFLLITVSTIAAACGDGESGGEAATTVPGTPTEGAPPTAAGPDIRDEDLASQPVLSDFIATAGGSVAVDRITYVDLTGDGLDDAVVPVSSGGEGGDIAAFVFGYGEDGIEELLRVLPDESSSFAVSVEDGLLTTIEGVYGPGEPSCCPSQQLVTTYSWRDGAFVASEETIAREG